MMYEVSIYYAVASECPLQEARFHLCAEGHSHARAIARQRMRQEFAGEVADSTYVNGISWLVPGVVQSRRLA